QLPAIAFGVGGQPAPLGGLAKAALQAMLAAVRYVYGGAKLVLAAPRACYHLLVGPTAGHGLVVQAKLVLVIAKRADHLDVETLARGVVHHTTKGVGRLAAQVKLVVVMAQIGRAHV